MKSIKDITRIVRFAIVSTPDKDLWTHQLADVDEARTDDTYYIAALMVGEENGKSVKETFETLMDEAGGSWSELCELFAALFFYAMAAHQDGDACAYIEYLECMGEVTSALDEKFAEEKPSWSRFVNSLGKVNDVNFMKNAKKDYRG